MSDPVIATRVTPTTENRAPIYPTSFINNPVETEPTDLDK